MNRGFRWSAVLPTHWVLNFATLGPVGYWGKAPGTMGSIAGIFLYLVFFHMLAPLYYILLLAFLLYFAVGICGEAEVRMHKHDPSEVVLDEFIAVPFCFIGLRGFMVDHWPWLILLIGFGLFRLFDIAKPLIVGRLQSIQGGWGIVMDDVAAALMACVCLHVGAFIWLHWMG